jgi:hypothetical protein
LFFPLFLPKESIEHVSFNSLFISVPFGIGLDKIKDKRKKVLSAFCLVSLTT